MRNKIFIGILIVGIILIGGWWILKSSVKQVLDEKYCKQDSDCVFGWPEKCIMGCVNKYTPKKTPCPLIRPAFFSSYIWDNTVCECVNNECVENRTVFCEEACRDWIGSNCADGIPKSSFLAMKCETKIDCGCLKSIQEVTITTDKTEYGQGEIVKITVKNNLVESIWYREWDTKCSGTSFSIGKKRDNEYSFYPLGLAECAMGEVELKPKATRIYALNLNEWKKTKFPHTDIDTGVYKWRFIYILKNGDKGSKTIHSNEFTIKEKEETSGEYRIYLSSRQFIPEPGISDTLKSILVNTSPKQMHVLLQFYHIPSNDERLELSNLNVTLCDYIHNNAYFASVPTRNLTGISNLSFIRWIGNILPEDKISSYIREGKIGDWAINEDGTVNVIVKFFRNISPEDAKNIIKKHKGTAKGEVGMLNDVTVSISKDRITELAKEDDVQWIEQVPPPPTIEEESG